MKTFSNHMVYADVARAWFGNKLCVLNFLLQQYLVMFEPFLRLFLNENDAAPCFALDNNHKYQQNFFWNFMRM